MKSETKVKGKSISGEWLSGSYHEVNGKTYIFPEDGTDSPDRYEVDPETVVQVITETTIILP